MSDAARFLPFSKQLEALEAIASSDLYTATRATLPSLFDPTSSNDAQLQEWLKDINNQIDLARKASTNEHYVFAQERLFAVIGNSLHEFTPNNEYAGGPETLDCFGQIEAASLVFTAVSDHQTVTIGPNSRAGFDMLARIGHLAFDINSDVAQDQYDKKGYTTLSVPNPYGVSDKALKFSPQLNAKQRINDEAARAVYDLSELSILKRSINKATPRCLFSICYKWNGQRFIWPLERAFTAELPEIDLNEIKNADLTFDGKNHKSRPDIYGQATVSGEVYFLRTDIDEPVPEGCIVLVDNEEGMEGVQAAFLEPAAAIISRGYHRVKNSDRARYTEGNNKNDHDHLSIICRGIAEQKPGRFIFFRMPHINPDDEELVSWKKLQRASGTVTVASDGISIKIKRDLA